MFSHTPECIGTPAPPLFGTVLRFVYETSLWLYEFRDYIWPQVLCIRTPGVPSEPAVAKMCNIGACMCGLKTKTPQQIETLTLEKGRPACQLPGWIPDVSTAIHDACAKWSSRPHIVRGCTGAAGGGVLRRRLAAEATSFCTATSLSA